MFRRLILWLSVPLFLLICFNTAHTQAAPVDLQGTSLVAVTLTMEDDLAHFAQTGLPLYTQLQGRDGAYLLTGADAPGLAALQQAGLDARILDADMRGAAYYLAYVMPHRAAPTWVDYGRLLLDDGRQVLLRMTPTAAARLAETGVQLRLLTPDAKPWPPVAAVMPASIDPDPLIQQMMDQVTTQAVYDYDGGLSGEWPVTIGGQPYTILTRNTTSGEPIQKATQYVGEHMDALGLDVEYHVWNASRPPNVIGERLGSVNPDDIYLITAHLDDMPTGPVAPGADDNASGSVAVLLATDILAQYEWGCTLRFAFWTGEEQGLLGSHAYAQRAYNQGENILGVLNLDMIAWNTPNSTPDMDLHATSSIPATLTLAQLFADVVDVYNLDLVPHIIPNGTGASDHASFWDYGYTAILGIEDYSGGDFNPYYHTTQDRLAALDLGYFTDFTKAALGSFAHMTGCLIPGGLGTLNGQVTAANGGAPIPGATVTMTDPMNYTYSATTDDGGSYTRALPAETYEVIATAFGYLPQTVTGVTVYTDTVTTQDFALQTAPNYLVYGKVLEAGTGTPLAAEVTVLDTPLPPVNTNPDTGFYYISLPADTYTLRVTAFGHQLVEREIVADHNQSQLFQLPPLPPILLVDDDDNAPDVRGTYMAALDALGYGYDVWDTGNSDNEPDAATLNQYSAVIWFTGSEFGGAAGPGGSGEAALADFLDHGRCLFISSQDYVYDRGVTPFMQSYLGLASAANDVYQTTVMGSGVYAGLGPYALVYPFSNWSDRLEPDGTAMVAFEGNMGNAALTKLADYHTTFWGFPFEALPAAARPLTLATTLNWCGVPPGPAVVMEMNYAYWMNNGSSGYGHYTLLADATFVDESNRTGTWTYLAGTPQKILLRYDPGLACDAISVGQFMTPQQVRGLRVCRDGSGAAGVWLGNLP